MCSKILTHLVRLRAVVFSLLRLLCCVEDSFFSRCCYLTVNAVTTIGGILGSRSILVLSLPSLHPPRTCLPPSFPRNKSRNIMNLASTPSGSGGEIRQAAQEASQALEAALSSFKECGGHCTDHDLGLAHFRLGKAYWRMGGKYRQDRNFAHGQWLRGAAFSGPAQVGETPQSRRH